VLITEGTECHAAIGSTALPFCEENEEKNAHTSQLWLSHTQTHGEETPNRATTIPQPSRK